ncbi:hypothetical protein CHLNCDRAFT_143519 [Chlorella variabilis]|uniref:Uncharacterized protein n=1 Tax=Chlorella variabilis TaxID=554065 RepID=E1ZB34_CHLVA|nr:hypothetical protein CHLNCDRAFT_143519 [Chlorella variabilis]EFN57159.1 hypothetical protein CHLNCDRAFT_143519 [Chlorella variabilis]|eukprot:XP_005849261.1 hypothetical protein CHLNCDRAFT_143519 [Chlorella variabilis]
MILSLAGDNLVPWTGVKSTQALAAVAGVLADGGLAVVGADTQLLRAAGNASSGGGRRLRRRLADAEASGVAAIPSLYTIMEAALIRATVQAPAGSQAAVQGVLVASAASGMLATRMRLRGLAVSQVQVMSVYPGTTNPPNLTALVPLTVANLSDASPPSPLSAVGTGFPVSSSGGLGTWEILVIAGALLGAAAASGALLWWLWRRKLARDGAAKAPPAFTFDGKELKKSPPPVRRTHSVNSLDLEGAYTPRYRQPITPRRAALKQSGYGATISVHASAAGGGKQLASGVQLLPRAPGAGGARMPVSMARTMAAVAGMQEARRAGVQAERYASQQAAEQAAMREYLKSKPPQVMWEDEAAARVARVAERLARSQSRLSSLPPGSVASRPSSYTSAGTSRAASEASYASSEILPAEGPGSQAPSTHSAHSGRSAQSVAQLPLGGHGGAARPEQLQRAAARVQSGSPRRSSARARGSFAVKEVEGGMAQAISRLARASSAPHEATVPPLHASRTGLTGAWVASGGRFNSSEVLEGVEEGLE